jgi:hypothetical protein
MSLRQWLAIAIALACMAGAVYAQDARGGITGRVMDPQGALVPGATVVITNVDTNAINRTASNQTGYFEASLLNPGNYSVSVEAPGFRRSVRTGLVVQVASRLDIEIQLQVGQLAETVEVTAVTPLLDTTSASGGRVIENREIMQLPFSDMNPFALSALAPGMQWTGQPEYRRPFDNGGTSAFNTMGGVGQNEYSIDGAPVTGTGRRVGFTPSSEAVSEFKLETATFDASYGHTSGATINVTSKSGTNEYHGALYNQHWQQRWNATPHFTRLAYEDAVRKGTKSKDDQKQGTGRSNQFGATLGGPVRIPKLYNGRDKLFFFFNYSGIYQSKAETTSSINRTVPKLAWRQGDFSDMLALDPVRYTVYDPRSARQEGSRVVRMPFPGNRGVPVLNPVYKFYEPLYPQPNNVPGLVGADGSNNYLAVAMPKDERFNSMLNRIDYTVNDSQRLFARWYWNNRLADEYDWTYETKRGLHANGLTRINKGAGGGYLWTLGATTILDLGLSYNRFNEGNSIPMQTSFNAAAVGLPGYIDAKAANYQTLPQMTIEAVENVSAGYPAMGTRGSTGEAKVQLTTVRGNHSIKYGWQERRYWRTSEGPGNSTGNFTFNNNYMRQADNTSTASNSGLAWAAFMMGLPSGMSIATNDTAYWSTRYRAFYVHDDLRITSRFRLALGLRYEREGGLTERYNRALSGGFLADYRPVFAPMAEAAYAKSPIAELPASQFKAMGGVEYLGTRYKTYSDGSHSLLPRLGAVYQLNSKTVLRGGYGWYYDTRNVNNDTAAQDGYSQATSTVMTTDTGLTFCCGVGSIANLSATRNPMVDPFPVRADGTRFDVPYGNTLGGLIRQGRGYEAIAREFRPDWQQRWRIGLQRQIGEKLAIDASYNGAYTKIGVYQSINALPQQYWATGNVRNQALDDDLNRNLPNPFHIGNLASLQTSDPAAYRYLTTQGFFTGTNIRKNNLLRPYPNMGTANLFGLRPGVDYKDSRGANIYHDLQLQVDRRFSGGFQTVAMYTYAYGRESDYYHNQFDTAPTFRPQDSIRPHRFVWSAIYQLPFGKGRTWVKDGPLQHIIGGWQTSWIYQYQTGATTNWGSGGHAHHPTGNRFFYGDLDNIADLFNHKGVNSKDIHVWFDPSIAYRGTGAIPQGFNGFEGRSAMQPGNFHVRAFPTRLTALREDGIRNWDVKIKRDFRINEGLRASFDVDLLNFTNHTNFSGPNVDPANVNFGRVTSQRGLSRVIQLNFRIDF